MPIKHQVLEALTKCVENQKLDQQEATIIKARWGLGGDQKPFTLQELRELYHCSNEDIREMETQVMRQVINYWSPQILDVLTKCVENQKLDQQEATIIKARWGLGSDQKPCTVKELQEIYLISYQDYGKIATKFINCLRMQAGDPPLSFEDEMGTILITITD
jgi:DNA-directed RNA polymerase sigma subunit (sigma70/sigma32)